MYQVINCQTLDPRRGFYAKSEKEKVTIFKCNNSKNCQAYKSGNCLMNILGAWAFPLRCPYGVRAENTGYTIRSRKCGELVDNAKTQYANCLNALHDKVEEFCIIGDYVYIRLPHLKNDVNPILDFSNSETEYLVRRDRFTPEFIVELIQYKPLDWHHEVIDCYQRKHMPQFINLLREKMPKLYAEIQRIHPDVDKIL